MVLNPVEWRSQFGTDGHVCPYIAHNYGIDTVFWQVSFA